MSSSDSILDDSDDRSTKELSSRKKPLGTVYLTAIVYFYCFADPGIQGEALFAGGPLWCFVITFILPWIYALPLVLITTEQATRFPYVGGCVQWAFCFGSNFGKVNAMLRFVTNLLDNPCYLLNAADSLSQAVPELVNDQWYRTIIFLLSILLMLGMNLSGIRAVSVLLVPMAFVVLLPFLFFFLFATPEMAPSAVFAPMPEEVEMDIPSLVSLMYWQYAGYDTVASLVSEVSNTRNAYLKSMLFIVFLSWIFYIFSGIAGSVAEPNMELWEDSDFGLYSLNLPGCADGWLAIWLRIACCLSAVLCYLTAVAVTAREFYAGALFDAFPFSWFLTRVDRTLQGERSPICAILTLAVLSVPFTYYDMDSLADLSALFTVVQVGIQCASFVAMRFQSRVEQLESERHDQKIPLCRDDIEPYILPFGWVGVVVSLLPIAAISAYLVYASGWVSVVILIGALLAMALLKLLEYGILKLISKFRVAAPVEPVDDFLVDYDDDIANYENAF
jgi:amino acid transporter